MKATSDSGLFCFWPNGDRVATALFDDETAIVHWVLNASFLYDAVLFDCVFHAAPFPGHVPVRCQTEREGPHMVGPFSHSVFTLVVLPVSLPVAGG